MSSNKRILITCIKWSKNAKKAQYTVSCWLLLAKAAVVRSAGKIKLNEII